jgi:hypothetical protein
MKFFKFFFLFVISASLAVILNSCNDTTTNPVDNPQPKPSPVTNLMATSINDSTVAIKFDASPSETNSLFKNYILSVYENSPTAANNFPINAGTNSYNVSGLTEGKIYNFQIVANYTNDSASTPVVIQWSPASRFELNVNSEPIWVYETLSGFGSGLMLFNLAGGAPKVLKTTSNEGWDLGLYTKNDSIIFGSATQLNYNLTVIPKPTQILSDYFKANSLNEVYDSQAMNAGAREAKYDDQAFDFTGLNPTNNSIFYVRKADANNKYNYAKVMIMKNPNGAGFLQGTAPNRYFVIQISYQKTAGVPYAKVAQNNKTK